MASEDRTFDKRRLDELLRPFRDVDGALLPILHTVQEEFGYVPPEALGPIADFLHATPPQIYSIVTFYSEFRTEPRPETVIGVCRGPACRLLGALDLQQQLERRLGIGPGEATPDGRVGLETVACLGICGLGPAIEVGREMIGRVDELQLEAIVESAAHPKEEG